MYGAGYGTGYGSYGSYGGYSGIGSTYGSYGGVGSSYGSAYGSYGGLGRTTSMNGNQNLPNNEDPNRPPEQEINHSIFLLMA